MLVLDSERLTSIRCCQEWELVYRRKSLLLWLNASFLLFFVPKSCNSTQDLVRNRQRFMVVQRCTYFQVMFSYALPLSFSNFTLGKTKKKIECSRSTLSLHFFRDEFWWKANSGWKFIGLVCCWCVDTSLFMFSLLSYMRTRKPRPKRRYFYDLNFLLQCKPQSSRLRDFPICSVHSSIYAQALEKNCAKIIPTCQEFKPKTVVRVFRSRSSLLRSHLSGCHATLCVTFRKTAVKETRVAVAAAHASTLRKMF